VNAVELKKPSLHHLAGYLDALKRGWSPDNLRDEVRGEEIREIERDADAFLAAQDDPEAKGPPIRVADGSFVARLPGIHRWLWDGEFCGSIGLRWQAGTPDLPPTCPGHIGYAVVPWKRGRGYATAALHLILPEARAAGLPYVDVTTGLDNEASKRVILANGGVFVERFPRGPQFGGSEGVRYRIQLDA